MHILYKHTNHLTKLITTYGERLNFIDYQYPEILGRVNTSPYRKGGGGISKFFPVTLLLNK